jgi:hypothetical protein
MSVHLGKRKRDAEYFCQDLVLLVCDSYMHRLDSSEDHTFQVENTLFRVPTFIFKQSKVFEDMFSVPQNADGIREGTDEDHPLILPPESYQAKDIRLLLKVLLPQSVLGVTRLGNVLLSRF